MLVVFSPIVVAYTKVIFLYDFVAPLMKKLSLTPTRKSLLTIYKVFVRPNLDHVDTIYNIATNKSFKRKIEMVQYNVALIITGAFKGTLRDKIYLEFVLKSLTYQID